MKKSFFAYLSRLKHIKRWGLMRNTIEENVQEHSFHVSVVAHALCIIRNTYFGGTMDEGEVALCALYHETGEAITGDLPTPIKYFNPEVTQVYKKIERFAEERMLEMLPDEMRGSIAKYVLQEVAPEVRQIVKAADRLCAHIKCLEEEKSGNMEFSRAKIRTMEKIQEMHLPEVEYFVQHFLPEYALTLDELNG